MFILFFLFFFGATNRKRGRDRVGSKAKSLLVRVFCCLMYNRVSTVVSAISPVSPTSISLSLLFLSFSLI